MQAQSVKPYNPKVYHAAGVERARRWIARVTRSGRDATTCTRIRFGSRPRGFVACGQTAFASLP